MSQYIHRICILIVAMSFAQAVRPQYSNINVDLKTVGEMTVAYGAEVLAEMKNDTLLGSILKHYGEAGVASSGIYWTKLHDRKAMKDAGWFSSEECLYYKRIRSLVKDGIMPKTLSVAELMVKHPERALYWGPYLYRILQQTKSLCMDYETVVANGHVTFKDITFLAINDKLSGLFDLARLGNVDWKALFDQITDFKGGLTRDQLNEDIQRIVDAGKEIASAGGASLNRAWMDAGNVGGIFKKKPEEIIKIFDEHRELFKLMSNPDHIKSLVMEQIETTGREALDKLFQVSDYNISNYISNYIDALKGHYYKQRWWIYWVDKGTKVLAEHTPVAQDSRHGDWDPEWKEFVSERDYVYCHLLTADEIADLKRMAYDKAWAKSPLSGKYKDVEDYNRQHPGHSATVEYSLMHKDFNEQYKNSMFGSTHTKRHCFYAYEVRIVDTWYIENNVYEETFDSQTMSEAAMQLKFNNKVAELNDIGTEDGSPRPPCQIGKGEKIYYDMADAERVHGASEVSFIVSCEDKDRPYLEGNFQWKEDRPERNPLDEKAKDYAMEASIGTLDTSEFDEAIRAAQENVNALDREIGALNAQIREIEQQMRNQTSIFADLSRQREDLQKEVEQKSGTLQDARNELNELQAHRAELIEDYAESDDGPYRIPSAMLDLETKFGIVWTDQGEWTSFSHDKGVFERHGKLPMLDGIHTFRAELTPARKESWFLFIRYHRAILHVHWYIEASSNTSDVADVIKLDAGNTDEQNAAIVNKRLNELMAENPGCSVRAEYTNAKTPQEFEQGGDPLHLLWVSDRLAVARDIEARLSGIYAQLVSAEKFLRQELSIEDYLRSSGVSSLGKVAHGTVSRMVFGRWRRGARGLRIYNSVPEAIIYSRSTEDE